MTKIKICGLMAPGDIDAVNEVLPDYIGFVFAPSRRQISHARAAALKARLDPGIQAVGVFVNAPFEEMVSLAADKTIDAIQLHGDENDETIPELKRRTQVPIIRAVRVKNKEDILKAADSPSDYLLFDTFTKDAYGGSGHTFDWSLIPTLNRPYFLAGGLNQNNIHHAAHTPAFCLDISSGVETDGRKDTVKIKHIVQTIKEISLWQSENSASTAVSSCRRR